MDWDPREPPDPFDEAWGRNRTLPKEPPIPCKGYWTHTTNGEDFECEYGPAGAFGCEECIVNGGKKDPRGEDEG